jgi:hypothetical protein
MVGVGGFEPPTSWSQTMRANRTALHPVSLDSMVPLAGLEPTLLAPEASALSSELQGHNRIILFLHSAFKQAFSYQLSILGKTQKLRPS